MRAFVWAHQSTYHMASALTCARCSEGKCLVNKSKMFGGRFDVTAAASPSAH